MSQSVPNGQQAETADVIVVGAGPAGSAAAYHLAKAGLDVLLLEKTAFPREKVCGDGLTPRRHQAAHQHGHRHLRRGRLDPQLRSADPGRRARPAARLAGPGQPPELRPDPEPDGLRRHARPAGREGRGAAARADQRQRPDPGRPAATSSASPRSRSTTTAGGRRRRGVPGAAGDGRRRQLVAAQHRDGPAQARRPADGCRRPDVLHQPADRRRLPRVVARAVGRRPQAAGPASAAARVRLDLRDGRRHRQRRARHPQHLRRVRQGRLRATC